MMFPKKKTQPNSMSVEDYRVMVQSNPLMIPKKSMLKEKKSPTMRAECSESDLQSYANEAIELRRWAYIRFPDAFLTWMKLNTSPWIQKIFFEQVGGKLPDNLILLPMGGGFFLGAKLELKTQDKKGRAVGRLHGKQKTYATNEEWLIARSPEAINAALDKIGKKFAMIKKVVDSETV